MNKKLNKIIFLSAGILLVCQTFLSSQRATDGDQYLAIKNQIDQIQIENTLITNEILTISTLSKVDEYAKNSSMVHARVEELAPPKFAVLPKSP